MATSTQRVTNGTETDGPSPKETGGPKLRNAAEGMRGAAEGVRGAAAGLAAQVPSMTAQTRDLVDSATRQMERSPDDVLALGTALTTGIAIGMFLAGAPRLTVALALIPAGAMGATLLDRRTQARTGT